MKSASCATFANFDFWRVVLDEAAGRIVVQNMSGYTTRTTVCWLRGIFGYTTRTILCWLKAMFWLHDTNNIVMAEGYIWLHDKNNIVLAEGYVLVTRHEQHCVG